MHTLLLTFKTISISFTCVKTIDCKNKLSRSTETRFSEDSINAQTDTVQFVHESILQFHLIDSTHESNFAFSSKVKKQLCNVHMAHVHAAMCVLVV